MATPVYSTPVLGCIFEYRRSSIRLCGAGFAVDGVSMMPTLRDGQPLLVQKAGYTPTVGDVVVLTKSSFREGDPIVKRVIAVGG